MNSEHLGDAAKRSLSPSDEAIHSFVKNVTSKMSRVLSATITKWFKSPNTSNTNGSAAMADTSDSSTEDNDTETPNSTDYLPPPLKKMCLNRPDVFEHKTSEISTIESMGPMMTKSYEPVPALYTPVKRHFNKGSDIVSSPMTIVGEHKIEKAEKSDISHSFNSSMEKRKSLFGTPNETSTKASLRSFNNTCRDPKQPSFKPALLGSPFYPGRTMYGGAGAYINYPNIQQRKTTVVNESNTNDNTLSQATNRVMELLEQYSSPLVDARQMPQIVKSPSNYKKRIDNIQNSFSLYKNTELQVPSYTQLLKLKQRSRLMESTKAARQIIASHSSTDNSPYPDFNSHKTKKENELLERQSSQSLKVKSRLTRKNRGCNDIDLINSSVELPNAVLQVDSLPIFTSSPVISKKSSTLVSDQTNELSTLEKNKTMYTFSKPGSISDLPYTSSINNEFVFGSPEKNLIKPTKKETEKSFTETSTSPAALETKTLHCSSCWVFNDPNLDNCKICSRKKAVQPETVSKCKVCKLVNSEINKDTCVNCEINSPVKKSSSSAQWKCSDCWVLNDDIEQNCVCCGGKKPNIVKNFSEKNCIELPKPPCTWKCTTCFVSNDNDQKKCVCCSAKKSSSGTNKIFTNKSQNMWKCSICLINNRKDLKACEACGNKKDEGSDKTSELSSKSINKSMEEKWKCPECLVRNKSSAVKCICCESVKPGCETSESNSFSFDLNTNATFKFGIDPMLHIKKSVISKEKKPETVTSQSFKEAETNNNILTKPSTINFDINPTQVIKSEEQTGVIKFEQDLLKPTFSFGVPKQQSEKLQTSTIADPSYHHNKPSHCNIFGIEKTQVNVFGQSKTDAVASQSLKGAETNNNILTKSLTCSFDVNLNQVARSEGQTDDKNCKEDVSKPTFTFGVPKQSEKLKESTITIPPYTHATVFHSNLFEPIKKQDLTLEKNEIIEDGPKSNGKSEPLRETKPTNSVSAQSTKINFNEPNNFTKPSDLPLAQPNTINDNLNIKQNNFSFKSGSLLANETAIEQSKLSNTSIFQFDAIPNESNHSTRSSFKFTSGSIFGNRDPIATTTLTDTSPKSEPSDVRSNLFGKQIVSTTTTTISALPITTPIFSFGASKVPMQEKPSTSFNFGSVDPRLIFKNALSPDNSPQTKRKQILSEMSTFTPANTTLPNMLGNNQIVPNSSLGSNNSTAGGLTVQTTVGGNGLPNSNPLSSLLPTNGLPSSNAPQMPAAFGIFGSQTQTDSGSSWPAGNKMPKQVFSFGSTPFNQNTTFGNNTPTSTSIFGINTQKQNAQPTLFSTSVSAQNQETSNLFGSHQAANNPSQSGLFGNSNLGAAPPFGTPNPTIPTFEVPSLPSVPAPAFNFGSSPGAGVFGFGQPTQGGGVYNFSASPGSAPQVQFSMGSGTSDVVKRVKKRAVRRIQR